jgi:hypothetical protein
MPSRITPTWRRIWSATPGIHCTVNFVPVLLDQIEDYTAQFATGQWRDPLLRIASWPDPDTLKTEDRDWLLDMAFRCHAPTMLEPFAPTAGCATFWLLSAIRMAMA